MKIDKQLWDDSMKALTAKVNDDSVELEKRVINGDNPWRDFVPEEHHYMPMEYYYRIKKERKIREVAHFEVWDDNMDYRDVRCLMVVDDKPFRLGGHEYTFFDNYKEIPGTRRTEDIG